MARKRSEGRDAFIGRSDELRLMRSALIRATSGGGGTVLLAGEAGIGKTTTANEIARFGREKGCEVLLGSCHEGSGAPAYWPWKQIMRAFVHGRDAADALEILGPRAPIIAEAVPHVAEHLGDLPSAPAIADQNSARFRLHDAFATVLHDASERTPLVVVVDDLHWADEGSLQFLEFLAHQISGTPTLLIGTYRDTEITQGHPLHRCLGDLERVPTFEQIRLEGFVESEIGRLMKNLLERKLDRLSVTGILERTDGNPLYVKLLAREMREEDATSHRVSASVREVITRRLERTPEICREVLPVAALLGREFDVTILGVVTGKSPGNLEKILDGAVGGGVIERQRSHAKISDAIEQVYGEGVYTEYAAVYAEHCALAGGEIERDRLVRAFGAAGKAALAQYDFSKAVRYFSRAIEERGDAAIDEEGADLLFGLARARYTADRSEESEKSIDSFVAAFNYYASEGLKDKATAVAAHSFYTSFPAAGILKDMWEHALRLVDRGSRTEGRILVSMSAPRFYETGDIEELEQRLGRALDIAHRCADKDLETRTLTFWAYVDVSCGRYREARTKIEKAYALARDLQDLYMKVVLLSLRRDILRSAWPAAGELESAAEELLDAAARLGDPKWLTEAWLEMLTLSDDYEEKKRWSDLILSVDPRHFIVLSRRVSMSLDVGRFGEAEKYLRKLHIIARDSSSGSKERVRFALAAANFMEATGRNDAELISIVKEYAQDFRYSDNLFDPRKLSADYAKWALAVNTKDVTLAREYYPDAAERMRADKFGSAMGLMWPPRLARCAGMVEEAVTGYRHALEYVKRRPRRNSFTAIATFELAQALTERGREKDRAEALQLLSDALVITEERGYIPLETKIRELLDAVRGLHADGLTERELDVLRLVGAGKTNKEIGSELYISPKTVDTHVRSILRKTGCANRAGAATYATRHGLLTEE